MAFKRWRVFLDTSALIAGIISAAGAAREVLRLCEAGAVEVCVSRQALIEADRTFSEKLPDLVFDIFRCKARALQNRDARRVPGGVQTVSIP